MNRDIFEGKWKKCEARSRSGGANSPTTNLDKAGGKSDQLHRPAPAKYGYTARSRKEFDRRLKEAK